MINNNWSKHTHTRARASDSEKCLAEPQNDNLVPNSKRSFDSCIIITTINKCMINNFLCYCFQTAYRSRKNIGGRAHTHTHAIKPRERENESGFVSLVFYHFVCVVCTCVAHYFFDVCVNLCYKSKFICVQSVWFSPVFLEIRWDSWLNYCISAPKLFIPNL